LILTEKYTKAVNNRVQKISIKYNRSDELIINGINDKQKLAKLRVNIKKFETLNMSLDLFSN
jgi:hypothetical protein